MPSVEAFLKQGLGLYYYKKENATLEEDFFVRTKDELVPVEVKANKNRSKSLRKLIDNESYSDIKWMTMAPRPMLTSAAP